MPKTAVEGEARVVLKISPADKARVMRAAALEQTRLKDFILRNALRAADVVIDRAERIVLSERDTRLWIDLLNHPPKANARLVAAAKLLPARS